MNQANFSEEEDRNDDSDLVPLDEIDELSNEINPSSEPEFEAAPESETSLEPLDDTPILAELVHSDPSEQVSHSQNNPYADTPPPQRFVAAPPLDLSNELHNMACIGGSVGALVLGIWSILCSLITPYAAINGVLAILLGIYGWSSPRRQMAAIGMGLGLLGMLMSMMEINEMLTK